jgi:hypothetical protein
MERDEVIVGANRASLGPDKCANAVVLGESEGLSFLSSGHGVSRP